MNPVEVESESNGDAIKDNNEQKILTEDTESNAEVMDEMKTKTENENEATKPEFRESNGHEPNADNVKKGEPNNNKGMKPVEVEKIESNGNDAKDNNDPKKLTEDTESKSEVMDEVKTKTENENEATKPEFRKSNGHEPNVDNVKKGEPNNNKGMKPVEVEKIESNGNDAKDNNDPKKLTEDTKSKSEVVDEVKTETENENEATKPEVREKDNEVTDDKQTKTDNNKDDNENEAKKKSEDKEKFSSFKEFYSNQCKTHKRKR